MDRTIRHIVNQLKKIQDGPLWVGANYSKRLSGVDDDAAFIRPIKGLHSIAEIISHLTFWRRETLLKIKTGTASKTDACPGKLVV